MSRSGYSYDYEHANLWRGAVARAVQGKRGQRLLRELAEALDSMPEKRLASGSFSTDRGVCTLGCLGQAKGLDMSKLNMLAEDDDTWSLREEASNVFDAADALTAEVMFENDEFGWNETPEQRWERMRGWVRRNLREDGEG